MNTSTLSIANTIAKQLGGLNRLTLMTGARDFVGSEEGRYLHIRLPRGKAKDGINSIKITLDADDTYTMTFARQAGANGGFKLITVKEIEGVYCDQLVKIFETTTGLYLSL